MEEKNEDMDKVKKLMVYPVFLVIFCKHRFLYTSECSPSQIPDNLFHDGCRSAYAILKLMSASTFILPALPFLLLGLLLFLYVLKRFWFNGLCPLRQRRILMGIPIFGTFIKLYETYFFASQFSGLLSGGLSINESIKLFSINQQQPFYQKLCSIIKDDLMREDRLK